VGAGANFLRGHRIQNGIIIDGDFAHKYGNPGRILDVIVEVNIIREKVAVFCFGRKRRHKFGVRVEISAEITGVIGYFFHCADIL
jgi:hypothetical protein